MIGRLSTLALVLGLVGIVVQPRAAARQSTAPQTLIDWATDGGDAQRTGWVRDEKILTKETVGGLKLQWKRETGNEPRALHSLMPALIAAKVDTSDGPKQLAIVAGISDNITAL